MKEHTAYIIAMCNSMCEARRMLSKNTSGTFLLATAKQQIAALEPIVDAILSNTDLDCENRITEPVIGTGSLLLARSLRARCVSDITLTDQKWESLLKTTSKGYIEGLLSGVTSYANLALPVFDKIYGGDDAYMDLMIRAASRDLVRPFNSFDRLKVWQDKHPQASATFLRTQISTFPKPWALAMSVSAFDCSHDRHILMWMAGGELPDQNDYKDKAGAKFFNLASSNHGRIEIMGKLQSLEHALSHPALVQEFVATLA